jgi:hypothetical protein
MTLREVGELLDLSRQRLTDLIRVGQLRSRLVLSERGVAQRLVQREDVERLLRERQERAETMTGKGRRPKIPPSSAS